MKNPTEIKVLAYERLAEARVLAENAKYDGAFYLAGYSIELMLKAKVCNHLGIDGLFDEQCQFYGISEVRKALKTHDIMVLLIFSGLKDKFEEARSQNKVFMKATSCLFDTSGKFIWNEQIRYKPYGSQQQSVVEEFLSVLEGEQGLIKWIETN